MSNVYLVRFHSSNEAHVFSSLKAIFTVFSRDDIGVSYKTITNRPTAVKIEPYTTRLCTISYVPVIGCKHQPKG